MSCPNQHVIELDRHGRHWIARCTCGTAAVALRISDCLDRIPHEVKSKEAVA